VRKGLGIALAVGAAAGVLIVAINRREASVEDHLMAYYAAQRNYHLAGGGVGVPTVRDRLARGWYKWRGKDKVEFLNKMAKHQGALEDLGYLETHLFVVSNRPPHDVVSDVRPKAVSVAPIHGLNSLANIWASPTNRIFVLAPTIEMPKWEQWIREADVPATK
jgi:hypothetical protein